MSLFNEADVSAETLARARNGEAAAHESIYRAFSRPAYTLIRRIVARPAVAEELLQDVFVEVLRSLGNFSGHGSFAGWVRSIAVSKALMYLRSPWHRSVQWLGPDGNEDLRDHLSDGNHPGAADNRDADLERALVQLPAITRSIVWLHDVEGYTHGEIARLFGRTASFSKSQLSRAHERLRELLEPEALESGSGAATCTPASRNY
jgi:RNA polymerase sigma factor (sigma-70 family)